MARNASSPPVCAPVMRAPTAVAAAELEPFFCSFSMTGSRTVRNPSALARIHAGRSMTATEEPSVSATRPV